MMIALSRFLVPIVLEDAERYPDSLVSLGRGDKNPEADRRSGELGDRGS